MPDSSVLPCCISPYDDSYGDGKKETLKEIWNSEKFKQLRLNMMSGTESPGCSRCYSIEKMGLGSMRQFLNQDFKNSADIIKETQIDGSLENINLKYLDIRFSNLCNFKCRGCGPALSSAWYDEHQLLYNYKSSDPKVKSIAANSPNFWSDIKSFVPHVEEIYFGGGEPLITKEHYEVLKMLDSEKKYDVRLSYNTNLSQLNYGNVDLATIWAKFKKVTLGISLDDIEERAEYFRSGTNWKAIEKNIFKLRDEYKGLYLYINCTVNIMNVYYLPEIFNYLMENNIIDSESFNLNIMLDPEELTIQVMSDDMKKKVKEKLLEHVGKLILKGGAFAKAIYDVKKIINFMEEKNQSHLLPKFRKNTLELDKIRSENFTKTFPDLVELL